MRFRLPRPGAAVDALRDLARHSPDEAEEYFEEHEEVWETLAEGNPHSAADILEALTEESAVELLADLDIDEASEVLNEMRPEAAADILEELEPATAADYVAGMSADQAADVVGALEEETRDALLAALDTDTAAEVIRLLEFASDSAGGLMTTDVAALPQGLTAGEAIETLRRLNEELGSISYVYVLDDEDRLTGVLSFRELVFARPGQGLDEVMVPDPYLVTTDTDREVVAELIQRYRLLALPVVDAEGRLVGIVRFDEVLEAAQEEATEDIAAMVGAGIEESVFTPVPISVRRRLPWILFNLGVGYVNSRVILGFESTIAAMAAVAAYMPLAGAVGGNSGAQSLAVIIRSMALGDLPPGRALRAVRRELFVALTNAALVAIAAGVLGSLLSGDRRLGLVIAIAIGVNIIMAGLAGSAIPMLLRRLGLDPALASNIFLTMTTDLVGLSSYLLTARLLL